jgi:hypothetical protein
LKKLKGVSEVDQIVMFLENDPDHRNLPEKLNHKFKRLETCSDLIKKHGTRRKVIPIMIRIFKISTSLAYQEYNDCQMVFGSTLPSMRDYWVEVLLGLTMETRKKAIQKGDLRSASSSDKNLFNIVSEFFKGDSIPYDKIQPPTFILGFYPEMSNVNIPNDLDEQLKRLLKQKKKQVERFDEAEIIEDEDSDKK